MPINAKTHWPADAALAWQQAETLPAALQRHAQQTPDKAALIFYGRVITFAELAEATDRFAAWLQTRGVQPGDRVALYLENCPQFAIAFFGALKAGAINVCLNPMHKTAELQHEFADSGARLVVTAAQGFATLAPLRAATPLATIIVTAYQDFLPKQPTLAVPLSLLAATARHDGEDFLTILKTAPRLPALIERKPDDTALLQYTSGTTGAPKGAEITHGNLATNCELVRRCAPHYDDDVMLGVLPWFHISGLLFQLALMAHAGLTLVALGRFELTTFLAAIQQYRCTITSLIATLNIALVNAPQTREYDLSSLRLTISGGAAVPAEIARRWEEVFHHKLIEGYGLSETTAPLTLNPPQRPRYGTVGLPLPTAEVKIVSLDDGVTELPAGQRGEIVARGPMVMKGYWRQPRATAEALRDGWFYTGDVGSFDEEGYLTIAERKKDMLKVSGYSVFPAEVEALLYRHPAIAEVGVIGLPHAYRGEEPCAFVVLKPAANITEQEIVAWCRAEMAAYKAPRIVRFVDALPKTASGKILKRVLREMGGTGS